MNGPLPKSTNVATGRRPLVIRRDALILVALFVALAFILYYRLSRGAGLTVSAAPDAVDANPAGADRILFLGNSFTSVNNLPQVLSGIAASLGDRVVVAMYAPGGYTLEQHAKDPVTLRMIQAKEWDFVVLQEQSQRPSFEASQVAEQVIPNAVLLDKAVRSSHARARTIFYETWGRKDGDASNCPQLPAVCTYDGMQRRLSETYAELAKTTSGMLAPVGTAWSRLRRTHPEVNPYAGDGIHPSEVGTYLAACVFYSTVFGKSPVGAAALGLPASAAELLQRIAEETAAGPSRPAR